MSPQRLGYLGVLLVTALALGASPARAQTTLINVLNTDQDFIQNALHDGTQETKDAALAIVRGVRPEVRQFAHTIQDDLSGPNSRIVSLAQQKNMLITPAGNVSSVAAAVANGAPMTDASTTSSAVIISDTTPYGVGGKMPPDRGFEQEVGPAFDRSYMRYELEQHLIDIALYSNEISAGHDLDVKAHAIALLPVLYSELNAAQRFLGVPETAMPTT